MSPLMLDFKEGPKDVTVLNTPLFPKPYLVKALKCYYSSKPTGVQKKSKEEICGEVMKCFEASKVAVLPLQGEHQALLAFALAVGFFLVLTRVI